MPTRRAVQSKGTGAEHDKLLYFFGADGGDMGTRTSTGTLAM